MPDSQHSHAKVLIRADGNAAIGSGHLRRCLTLAIELRDRGHECLFVCSHSPQSFNGLVSAAGFTFFDLPYAGNFSEASDAKLVMEAVASHAPFNVVVVDHYQLGRAWEQALRAVASIVVVIDDLADRHHDCDFLIDVAPGASDRYHVFVPSSCRMLLGTNFALLRPEFRALRSARHISPEPIARVFISFGGADTTNFTGLAIAAVRRALPNVMINAVVTAMSPHREALEQQAADDDSLQIDVDAENMAELMMASDLAIGAGGSTSWERACLGLPSIVVAVAENQFHTVDALQSLGCAVAVAPGPQFVSDTSCIIGILSASPALRQSMSSAATSSVDGLGAIRIASAILPTKIVLRPVNEHDSRLVWEWRNAPEIRSTAIDSAVIPWDHHCIWFTGRISDANTVMLIAEDARGGVGVVRYDFDGADANVSIFLAPGNSGRGLGSIILRDGEQWVMTRHPKIKRFHASIRPENAASIALFEGANYHTTVISFERRTDG